MLSLHTSKLGHLERLATRPVDEMRKNLYVDEFRIEFLSNYTSGFVNKLYRKCEEKGMNA